MADADLEIAGERRRPARVVDYVAIMRLGHATRHVFILPGIVLALLLRPPRGGVAAWPIVAGFAVALLIASANYAINEWLDRKTDAHHPQKSARAAVRLEMPGALVFLQWALLVAGGCAIAASASRAMLVIACAFAAQGIVYNVRPLRLKDIPYVDVLAESINNPLRLMIGWAMIDPTTLPPSSILFAYWFGGAFLMATKRLSEYRTMAGAGGRERLARYRRSFARYDETNLAATSLIWAMFSVTMLAIFFLKYRIEYIFVLPPTILLFGRYLALAMRPGGTAQAPERLFAEPSLVWIVVVIVVVFGVCTVVDMPALEPLTAQHFIRLG